MEDCHAVLVRLGQRIDFLASGETTGGVFRAHAPAVTNRQTELEPLHLQPIKRGLIMKATEAGSLLALSMALAISGVAHGQPPATTDTSYLPVVTKESHTAIRTRMEASKPEIMKRQLDLLNDRYDLSDRPAAGIVMSRGKPVQDGVRAKLPASVTWEALAAMTPDEIKDKDLFPPGFLPLPHPNHPEGGMVFPKFHIDEIKKQEDRDLTRFDLDFDLPDQFLPEFPPPIYLTTRPDLGDVSQGQARHASRTTSSCSTAS